MDMWFIATETQARWKGPGKVLGQVISINYAWKYPCHVTLSRNTANLRNISQTTNAKIDSSSDKNNTSRMDWIVIMLKIRIRIVVN